MLIKVGKYRINLTHVARIDDVQSKVEVDVFFIDGESITLTGDQAVIFCNAWDKWAQFQNDAQYVNEYNASAAIEQIKEIQKRGGIVQPVPAMPRLNRGR